METIQISKSVSVNALPLVFGSTVGKIGNANSWSQFRIYKGTVPTQAQVNALSDIASLNYLASLVAGTQGPLLQWSLGANATFLNNTVTMPALPYATASGGGAASWFILFCSNNNPGQTTAGLTHVIIGTVTDGSGNGDLKLGNATIVNGQSYKVNAMKLTIPYVLNF